MTIDERLEKLIERHEALTQTVELMVIENREQFRKQGTQIDQIMEGMARLLHIAEIHEQRMERLEKGK
jgi:hypothetical protein